MEKLSKKELRKAKIELADLLCAKHNLRITHVRPTRDGVTREHKNGVTVVWSKRDRAHANDDRIISVSVAIVNEHDSYCKLTGRLLAAARYNDGNFIQLRVPKNIPPTRFIKDMFDLMVYS